jgi:hypothetical protein
VSTDISEEMIKLVKGKFDGDLDFQAVKGNQYDIKVEEIES